METIPVYLSSLVPYDNVLSVLPHTAVSRNFSFKENATCTSYSYAPGRVI